MTEEEYETALSEIEKLMDGDPEPGTPQAAELSALILRVQDYEREHFGD